jgi:hypothetical protein
MNRNRDIRGRDAKDASLDDLLAVTATENSQDLTHKIRQLIYMDNHRQRMDYDSESQTDGMPSIIQESKNFANLFFDMKNFNDESSENFDAGKVKKIEFS